MSLTRFLRRGRWDDERARELEAHLAIEADENMARGMTPADARDAARKKLGNATLAREEIYEMNTVAFLDGAWRDLRYGARLLRLNPGFALVAILSLALGVGANTAIFQLLDAVRIRTLPVSDPQRLADVRFENPKGRNGRFTGRYPMLTNPLWEQIRDQQQAFSSAFAWTSLTFNLTSGGEARYAQGLLVSGQFFETLGVPALLGRTLTAEDDRRGCGAPPVVVSYGFWQREFGGSPSAIGRALMLDGHSYDVVGVTPASFFGVEVGRTYDIAAPLCAEPLSGAEKSMLDMTDGWFLGVMGRLKPDWSLERASAHLAALSPPMLQSSIAARYRAEDIRTYLQFRLGAFPAGTGVSGLRRNYESPLWLLLATTGLVLLIACANLANLMLARATAREREVAVRLAIGASRARIVRQLLAESLLLAGIGAAAGALLARWLSAILVGFLAGNSTSVFVDLALDWRVFAFTAVLAVATCLLFGLMPALRATSVAPGEAMKAGTRGSTDSRERFGLRRALVIAQVALSMVLVVGALLFVRSLRNLMTVDAGFRQEGILIVDLDLQHTSIAKARRTAFQEELTAKIAALPGVVSAAQAMTVPATGGFWNEQIVVDGTRHSENVNFNRIGPGFFRTMESQMLTGRDFDVRDTATSTRVAIVTESFARVYFPNRNPVGQAFQIDAPPSAPQPLLQIVGVVKDMKYEELREDFAPLAFVPAAQQSKPDADFRVVLRSFPEHGSVRSEVAGAVGAIDPAIVLEFNWLSTRLRGSLLRERLMATLSGFFGALAALLATIGLYGVMSYMVARRKNEIGIRMALGADRRDVVRLVMREASVLLAVGLMVGLVMAVAAARTAATLLFGLQPGDPATLAMAAVGLGAVAMLASYLPAIRASRLEPTEALREE